MIISLECLVSKFSINLQRWFDFMGNIDNGQAPFQINYVYHKNTILRPRTRNNERKTPYGPSVPSCDKEARPGLGMQVMH